MPRPDPLKTAAEAAEILDRLGIAAYGKKSEGRVTIDGWAQANGKRIAFSYELDDADRSAEELAASCVAKVQEALAKGA